ncbi:hypothetical protein Acr_14g0006520 [Actinidia rufa]|uniref:Uncharacterized protein n=1 Tax=Actinidia rufa TaxID=165716 RepID=A0A7J0FRI7_9ERIC|nr:hypothetical protein Acr_14g0006520 [Actinidia rufa]
MAEVVRELTEMKKVASAQIVQRSFGTPLDHPSWSATSPAMEMPDLLEPYSPILLLEFNKEEYTNLPTEDEPEVDGEGGDPMASSKLREKDWD